ncbi:response regulator transcription factor [Nonomuraea sp. 10N515B]|uniref:response regulator transcription factor n=1 Tax=Nonomuraea sp. 10N515B TaxID=3457422 RepID=UPI003FCC98D8
MSVRVLIADDHPVVRDGLAALLSTVPGMEGAGTASSGREAVRATVVLAPDVLVLDIQMPEMSGIDAAREVAAAAPGVAVLMLTMYEDDESVFAAMCAGPAGEPFPELTPREREVLGLIAAGHGNASIGARLSLAPKTVGNHIS